MLFVTLEVAEAGEQTHGQIHAARTDREPAHVGPDQRDVGDPAGQPEEGERQIHPDAPGAGGAEGAGVATRPASHVEDPPSRPETGRRGHEGDRPIRLDLVPVRIELEVFLTEPFLEPFRHAVAAHLPLWYGSP